MIILSRGLTQRGAARAGAGVGDLLAVGIHAPTLPNAAVALRGLVRSALIALRNVRASSWPRTEEGEEARASGGDSSLGSLSVQLTRGRLTL